VSTSDDDLLAALRRSADPADQRLAEQLSSLNPGRRGRAAGPRANDSLISFLVSADPAVSGVGEDVVAGSDAAPADLAVHLGTSEPPGRAARSVGATLAAMWRGAPAKAVLAATVALVGAGAAAATGAWQPVGPDTVVATPSSQQRPSAESADQEPVPDTAAHATAVPDLGRDGRDDRADGDAQAADRPEGDEPAGGPDVALPGRSEEGPAAGGRDDDGPERPSSHPDAVEPDEDEDPNEQSEHRGRDDGDPGDEDDDREDGDRDEDDGDEDDGEEDGGPDDRLSPDEDEPVDPDDEPEDD
jgi:hypothetical protein